MQQNTEVSNKTPLPPDEEQIRDHDDIHIDIIGSSEPDSSIQHVIAEGESVFKDGVLRQDLIETTDLIPDNKIQASPEDIVPEEFKILPSQIKAILHPPPPAPSASASAPAASADPSEPPPPPSCKDKVIGFFMKIEALRLRVKAFRAGTVFFTYNTLGFMGIEKEFSPKKQKPSLLHQVKEVLIVILLVSVFYGIFSRYQKLLGSEKSQGLKYKDMGNLTYPIKSVPMLFPAHTFSFFQEEDVVNRILCKTYGDAKQCTRTEEARCRAKGILTQAYEECMIALYTILKQNTPQFCTNHYNTPDLWMEDLDPSKPAHYERKHQCYFYAGVPKGRQYCLDLFTYTDSWTKDNFYNCLIKNGVSSAKEQCQDKFPIDEEGDPDEADENAKQQLACFGSKGVPQDKDYCDLLHRGEKRSLVFDRINCYDAIPFANKATCDTKAEFFNWDKEKTQKCYKAAGYKLNREFCNGFFIGPSQIDNRYTCYDLIGLSGEKDRDYCDLTYEDDIEKKYKCMNLVNSMKTEAHQMQCDNANAETGADIPTCLEEKKVSDPFIVLGEDYCFATFKWENEYEELQDCLRTEEAPQESTYCDRKFNYIKYDAEVLQEDPSLYDVNEFYACQEEYGIPNYDQTDNDCTQLGLVLNDTIMVTTQIPIENEEIDLFVGQETLIKKLKFIGGAIKLFKADVADLTSYLVFGDFGSDEFGKLTLYKNAPRTNADEDSSLITEETLEDAILPIKAEFLEGRSVSTWLDGIEGQEKEEGNWHFVGVNELVIDLMEQKTKYFFKYDPDTGKHTINSSDKEYVDLEVDFTNSGNIQTVAVEGWQKPITELYDDLPQMDCAFAYGDKKAKQDTFGWSATFDKAYTVQKIEIFNFQNGNQPSLLENSEVYIGDKICARIGNRPPVNRVMTVECQNPDFKPRNVFSSSYNKEEFDVYKNYDGTVGDSITIKSARPGHQVICDLKVFAQAPDQELTEKNAAGKANCQTWQDECRALENSEDKFNCLTRYGVPKTPQYCIETLRSSNSQYPLKKKYECMQDPRAPYVAVEVHKNVTACLQIYLEKSTELCLEIYESNFMNEMGFVGGNGTIEDPMYYRAYGNLTQDIQEIAAAAQIEQDKLDFLAKAELATAAVSDEVIIVDQQEMERFMCSHSFFYFYTNPYDDRIQAPWKDQNEQYVDGQCQVFRFYDVVSNTTMQVLHWFMNDKNMNIRTQIQDEKLKDNLVVNKTEMNSQLFRLEFNKELEFLATGKNQIYMRDQDPQNTELELPTIQNEQDYYKFISANITSKLYETEPMSIAEHKVDPIILDAQPYQNSYKGMPVRFQKKFLGYLLKFNDIKEKIAIVKPENEIRPAKATDEEYQSQDKFPIEISLRFDYTEMQFTFVYVQISDMISQIGGIMGIVMGLIGQFGVYLIIAYVVELLFLIKRKYKVDERQYVNETLSKRCPVFVKVIIELLQRHQGDPKKRNELKKDLKLIKELMPRLIDGKVSDAKLETFDELEISDDEEVPVDQQDEEKKEGLFGKFVDKLDDMMEVDEDEFRDQLIMLNNKYGNLWKELGIAHDAELFDEFDIVHRMLLGRCNTPIIGLIGRVKKNISFFGLYKLNDRIEFDIFRLENMKKKLQNTIMMLLNYQNKLMANLNDSKTLNYDKIEDKFMDISTQQPRQTERTRQQTKTREQYEEMIINIKNELFRLKMGIEEQNERENQKLTQDKKEHIRSIRTEIRRVMDTMQVQDISVKVHTRIQDMMNKHHKMDDKVVFGLEALVEYIEINQYDSIISKVRQIVSGVSEDEIESIRGTVGEMNMAVQNIQIKWMASDEILFNFIDKLQPNRISEIELCKATQKVFAEINEKFVRINNILAEIYRDDCE